MSEGPDVVISEFMEDAAVAGLAAEFDVHYDDGLVDRPDELRSLLGTARGLIVRNRTRVDTALLDAAPRLQVVGRLGVGLDNIDLEACAARSIAVRPALGANSVAVAEYVIGAALVLTRCVYDVSSEVVAGAWPRTATVGGEVMGRQMGLVGFGGIAREVAHRAAALGMTVAAYDPLLPPSDPAWDQAARMDLAELLATSDVVSIHVPLTAETEHMLDASAIGTMKREAVLINTSRGGIVEEPALVDALRSGHLAGAALDVFAAEPLDAAAGARFAGVPNLILTPHIAGLTVESNARVGTVTAANVRHVLMEA